MKNHDHLSNFPVSHTFMDQMIYYLKTELYMFSEQSPIILTTSSVENTWLLNS